MSRGKDWIEHITEPGHGAVEVLRAEACALDRICPSSAGAVRDFAAHVEARGFAGRATPAGTC